MPETTWYRNDVVVMNHYSVVFVRYVLHFVTTVFSVVAVRPNLKSFTSTTRLLLRYPISRDMLCSTLTVALFGVLFSTLTVNGKQYLKGQRGSLHPNETNTTCNRHRLEIFFDHKKKQRYCGSCDLCQFICQPKNPLR